MIYLARDGEKNVDYVTGDVADEDAARTAAAAAKGDGDGDEFTLVALTLEPGMAIAVDDLLERWALP